jgi:DNA-binding transcriptional ArsR family regulator
MARGVGKALEAAISAEGKKEISEKGKTIKFEFMNLNRQEIFQFLCLHPCSYSSMMSKSISLSLHTVNWHLRRLLESEYISKSTLGKKVVFYPTEMIATSDIPILELLNTEKAKLIYIQIAQSNGIFQGEICEKVQLRHQAVIWYTRKLETLGLITSLEDGKYRRYYPTELLQSRKNENEKRMKMFRERILNKFKGENLQPVIIRSIDEKLVVRISRGSSKAVLTLNTNPFVTVLS